jgi:DNA-binding MarR family transcriptional regulator
MGNVTIPHEFDNLRLGIRQIADKTTRRNYLILNYVIKTPRITAYEISSRTGIPRSAISKLVNNLVKLKLLQNERVISENGISQNQLFVTMVDPELIEQDLKILTKNDQVDQAWGEVNGQE